MEPKDGQIQSISASEQPYWKPTVKVHIRCIDGVVKTFFNYARSRRSSQRIGTGFFFQNTPLKPKGVKLVG